MVNVLEYNPEEWEPIGLKASGGAILFDPSEWEDYGKETVPIYGEDTPGIRERIADVDKAIEKAYNYLEQNPIQIVTEDKEITIPARFSYGIAKDFKGADEKLQVHKAAREARGDRSRRGEKPAGILETVPERIDTKDRRERIPETEVKPAEKTPEATPAKKSAEPATEPSEAVGSTISKKDEHPYEYSSVQHDLGTANAKDLKKFSSQIPENELFKDPDDPTVSGREKRPHLTVKYGLHTVDPKDVEPPLKDAGPIKAKVGMVEMLA